MTFEHFLQAFAIYTVFSILAVAWFVRIKNSTKKDKDKWPDGMA